MKKKSLKYIVASALVAGTLTVAGCDGSDPAPTDAGCPSGCPADAGCPAGCPTDAGCPAGCPTDAGCPSGCPADAG